MQKVEGYNLIKDLFETSVVNSLERGLDASSLRQRVLSNNLANVETPHYKRSEVSFEERLKETLSSQSHLSLTTTHSVHRSNNKQTSQLVPEVYTDKKSQMRNDGNNVDVDSEMAKLAINSIQYNTLIQQWGSYYSRLRNAINEGRR
jgi:flagellar basal-body rod protein FlgB